MERTVAAVFESIHNAKSAAEKLRETGNKTENISIAAKDEGGYQTGEIKNENTGVEYKNVTNDNISDGVMTGGILGGIAGLLIGAGSLAIPGLGIIAAAGPLAGLFTGAVTGGLVGGLVDLGIPEEKGREYEADIKAGRVFLSARIEAEKVDEVVKILKNSGAKSIDIY